MPAAKDLKLLKGHWTKEQIAEKEEAKLKTTSSAQLTVPDVIKNNINLYNIWENTLKLYDGTELVNALDGELLARYCIELNALKSLYKIREKKMSFDNKLKLESRIESKTKLVNQMAVSLYMTPRSRAGSIPNQSDKDADEDDPNAEMFD